LSFAFENPHRANSFYPHKLSSLLNFNLKAFAAENILSICMKVTAKSGGERRVFITVDC